MRISRSWRRCFPMPWRKQSTITARLCGRLIRMCWCRRFPARWWTATRNAISSLGRIKRSPFCLPMHPSTRRCALFVKMKQFPPGQTVRENLIVAPAAWILIPPKTSILRVTTLKCWSCCRKPILVKSRWFILTRHTIRAMTLSIMMNLELGVRNGTASAEIMTLMETRLSAH